MSLAEIRKQHGVPAKRGARIEYTDTAGRVWAGRITSADGALLRVRFDGHVRQVHPTWHVKYLSTCVIGVAKQEAA